MNLSAVGYMLGVILLLLAGFLLLPAAMALLTSEPAELWAFLLSAGIAAALGLSLAVWNRGTAVTSEGKPDYFRREGLAVSGLAWVVAGMVGALPYLFAGILTALPDAFFESVSGFTTTGSTVMSAEGIDGMPYSIAFWRSFTQWLGGFGIVMVFVVLFPTGGRSLFRTEVPGVTREATTQRVRDSALGLMRIYLGLTALNFVLLLWAGLGPFDALIHTLSTIPTGGFSNHSESVAYFLSWKVELILVFFMVAAGVHFSVYDLWLRLGPRKAWERLRRSSEIQLYLGTVLGVTLVMALILWLWGGGQGAPGDDLPDYRHFPLALRDSLFQVASLQTSSGYTTADFQRWPEVCHVLILGLAVIGGCAGSTAGGLKVVRFLIIARAASIGVRRFMRPRAVLNVRVGDETLEEGVVASVTGYFCLWALVLLGGIMVVAAFGYDLETSAAAVVATLNNIGPGLGKVGPTLNFGDLPGVLKVMLATFMILGRLEFYAVVVLLVPSFWRR